MLRNSADRYGLVAKLLHWILATLILGLVWLGWYMVDLTYFDPWYNRSLEWHKALGMIVLALALGKLLWLHVSPSPRLGATLPPWQRIAAKATHHTFVVMMLLIPLTGYTISTSDGKSVSLFGLVELPALWPRNEALRDWAIELHFYAAYGTALLALAHAAAAVKHQFYDRDGTLARMLWR
jgi:cytochrome b561